MKMKNVFALALSLLLSLSALHAVPTDPSAPVQMTILTNKDSGTSTSVNMSQGFFMVSLTSELSDDQFTFTDSCLVNGFKKPFAFGVNGLTADGVEELSLAATSATDPIYLEDSNEDFSHINQDGTNDDGTLKYNYNLVRTTGFTFFALAAGTTKLTFTNGAHTYTYNITVVDDLLPTPAQ
ncbi:MAG: hypothetical protein K2W97_00085 [Chthoniobacterales bacterium]|nr:hypothetical protein [Chthoniobacterales bacterium]